MLPVAVGGRQHDGVAKRLCLRRSIGPVGEALVGSTLRAQARRVGLRQQRSNGTFEKFGIGVVGEEVRIGELLRLDHEVPIFRSFSARGSPSVSSRRPFWHAGFQHVEHLVRRPVLRRRRQFQQRVAVIGAGCRLDPFAFVARRGRPASWCRRARSISRPARAPLRPCRSRPSPFFWMSRKVLARSGLR